VRPCIPRTDAIIFFPSCSKARRGNFVLLLGAANAYLYFAVAPAVFRAADEQHLT
jgi:hypothetical protein